MRFHFVLIGSLVAFTLALPKTESKITDLEQTIDYPSAHGIAIKESDLISREATGIEELEERQFTAFLSWVWSAASGFFPLALGLAPRVTSAATIAKTCFLNFTSCVNAAWSTVFMTFNLIFRAAAGRRDLNGNPVYGVAQITSIYGTPVTITAHIPVEHGKYGALHTAAKETSRQLRVRSIDGSGSNDSWTHIATVQWGEDSTHALLYRLASAEDLGMENDGSYHHLRANTTSSNYSGPLGKRIEDDVGGIVVDYIYKDGQENIWNDYMAEVQLEAPNEDNAQALGNEIGEHLGNWMTENNVEATCATLGLKAVNSNSIVLDENQAVAAYGWNNQPFNFAGRSAGWIASCHN